MRIIVEYTDTEPGFNPIFIASARYLSDYAIRVTFNDGKETLIDFKPFLTQSLHPSIQKFLNENLFSDFSVTDGNLNWNDYELIFPISDLYNGKISS